MSGRSGLIPGLAWLFGGAIVAFGCSGQSGSTATVTSRAPVFTAPIYSEVVPVSSGLPFVAGSDIQESFVAPNGKTVRVLVKGPAGVMPNTKCPGSSCYVMRPINRGETPDAYFPAAVQAALGAHAHKLVIPRGTYDFVGHAVSADSTNPDTCNEGHYWKCGAHWTIGSYPSGPITVPNGIADLDIDLSGSVLNFTAPSIGIVIQNAQRVRLENFTIDWPALPIASLGTVAVDPDNPGHNALVIGDVYSAVDPFTGSAAQIKAVDVWDSGANAANLDGDFDLSAGNRNETYFLGKAPQPTYVGKTAAGNQTYSCKSCNFVNGATDPTCNMFLGCANFDRFPVGTTMLVRHYTYNGFAIVVNWSNDIDIENARILTGPGMGIGVKNNGGFRGFRVANSAIVRGAGRLISTASDAINVAETSGDVIVEGNEVAYQGDDGLNLSSAFQAIASTAINGIAVTGGCEPGTQDFPVAGDALAFFAPSLSYLGTATVSAVNGSLCSGAKKLQLSLDCAGSATCQAMLPALTAADSFVDLTRKAAARYIVRNNNFHENRGHGVLVNAPYGLIAGNTCYRDSSGGILLGAGGGGGPGASNVVISGNTITWPGLDAQYFGAISFLASPAKGTPGTAPASVFQKIILDSNRIGSTQGPAIVATFATYLHMATNQLFDINLVTNAPGSAQTYFGNYGKASTRNSIVVYDAAQVQICATQITGSTSGVVGSDPPSTSGVTVAPECQ